MTNNNLVTSGRVYLNRQGVAASEGVKRMDNVRNIGELRSGQSFLDFHKKRMTLNKEELANFVDAAEGRAAPLNSKVDTLVNYWKDVGGKIAQEAESLKLGVRTGSGEIINFKSRENYFPHFTIEASSPKSVVNETLKAAVKRGDFGDDSKKATKLAKETWESYKEYVKSGKRGDKIFQNIVDSGQAKDKFEAEQKIKKFYYKRKES